MKQLSRIVVWSMLLLTPVMAYASQYPFADIVTWKEEAERKAYERYFTQAGLTVSHVPVMQTGEKQPWADQEEFVLIKRGETLVGYGAIFTSLKSFAYAVHANGDRRRIKVNKAEILYDLQGRVIFLISYRMDDLGWVEASLASLLGYKVRATRAIFSEDGLGEGYELSPQSKQLAHRLLQAPHLYKTLFEDGHLQNEKLLASSEFNFSAGLIRPE
ncbi:MAG: hypothetical protein D6736_18840 [Nitrospinota bacterium]|nr:MAG: hypothetical protein D6736_18840 [Nitrospinota bacterium]